MTLTNEQPRLAATDATTCAERRLHTVAGWSAIGFLLLFVAEIILGPDSGNPGDSTGRLTALLAAHPDGVQVFGWIAGVQVILLLVFAAGLRSRLVAAGQSNLGSLAFGAAAVSAALASVQHGCVDAMSYLARAGQTGDLVALNTLSASIETVLRFAMTVFAGAAALGALRSRSLPMWSGWLGLAVAVLCLIAGGATVRNGVLALGGPVAVLSLLVFLIWTVGSGIGLIRGNRGR
jgi:hypothetical protein